MTAGYSGSGGRAGILMAARLSGLSRFMTEQDNMNKKILAGHTGCERTDVSQAERSACRYVG